MQLECLHCLEHHDSTHLWLLHLIFLDLINTDCLDFQETWNLHPISGHRTKDVSPAVSSLESVAMKPSDISQELCFFGETTHWKTINELTSIHLDTLNHYCGVHGTEHCHGLNVTGAGHPPNEDSADKPEDLSSGESDALSNKGKDSDSSSHQDDYMEVQARLVLDLEGNVKHNAVQVPRHNNPFVGHLGVGGTFLWAFRDVGANGGLPQDFGVLEGEWGTGMYPAHRLLNSGHKGMELVIGLPTDIWCQNSFISLFVTF